ncbi:ribonuclease T2 family protein [Medicago truncatula]|uniref:Ribonuclease T2 family protein n=3 Tax=Medicago truncatula TaxID=3880 RepID=G7ILN4_MEDTR|nr:ribonuclease T2 family protein [Medicago truncatula]
MAAPRYHHLTRTDQWPPAACINSFRRCKHPIPKYFTLHGLWPSNRALPHPEWCTPPLFDPNEIVGLVSKLSVEWPNLFGADEILWRHQWEKHGSCTPFKEYDYFKLGIELMEEFNLTAILENNAIIPRVAPYRTQDISDAIEYSNLGVKPSLICVGVFLTEIKLCLDPLAQKYKVCPYLSKNCPNKLHLST